MYRIENNYCYEGIIHIYFEGQIGMDDIENLCLELETIVEDDKAFILSDVRHAKYSFGPHDIDLINTKVKTHSKLEVKVFEALLIDTPAEMAISTLFNMNDERLNHISKIFSTEKAALLWLLACM